MNKLYRNGIIVVLSLVLLLAGSVSRNLSAQSTGGKHVVTGTVFDENGIPLIGAGIVSEDGKRGAVTDLDGKYILTLLETDKIIVVSYIGYATQHIVLNGRNDINVSLKPDETNALNEVVVIGYGTSKKVDLTGSVASVKMADIEETPMVSIDQAIQGKIAGVDVVSSSGEPGSGSSIRVRGTRSLEATNEPLIVVDGVMDAVQDLNEINPADIESINILKDASSTAIYGSRGANGVVMITTKKGFTAKPSVNAKVTFGVSHLASNLDLMNTQELLRYRNDKVYFDNLIKNGTTTSTPAYDMNAYRNNVDWIDEITRTAFSETANVSLSGKTKSTSYFASVGLNNTEGIVDDSGFTRLSARFNISHDFTKWLTLGLQANYTYSEEKPNKATIGGRNIYTGAVYLAPYLGVYSDKNPLNEGGYSLNTPRALLDKVDYSKDRKAANYSGVITIKPCKGLIIKSQNTYTPYNAHVFKYEPSSLPGRYEEQGGKAYRKEYDSIKLLSENTVTYTGKYRGGHNLELLAGYSSSWQHSDNVEITADGILDDTLKWYNMNAVGSKENYTVKTYTDRVVRHSLFARGNYNYKSRYYLTMTARYDGSSNFAANRKWGFFPSGAFKWNISNEKFLKKVRWMDNLALRLSYGQSGNDGIAAYRSLGLYSTNTSGAIFGGSQGASFHPNRVPNPNLTWETTTAYNVGLDFSAFKNRLSITADAYYSHTDDLLLTLQTIQTTGFEKRYTNLGKTSNRGVELSINSVNFQRRNFGWTTELSVSYNDQMVEDVGHENYIPMLKSDGGYMMYGYKSGYPLNSLWGFQYEGVFKSKEELDENIDSKQYVTNVAYTGGKEKDGNVNEMKGRPKYKDVNNDGLLTEEDLVWLGSSDPIVNGGIQNTFNIYGFRLGMYFSYSLGGKIYNYSELTMAGAYSTNQYRYMLDSWHPVRNPDSDLPRAGSVEKHVPSSLQVHDASYLRLKTLSLSYKFDLSNNKNKGLKDITIGVSGENLLLFTKYNGFDPDVVYTDDELSVPLRRVDMGAYPRARTVVFTLQIRY